MKKWLLSICLLTLGVRCTSNDRSKERAPESTNISGHLNTSNLAISVSSPGQSQVIAYEDLDFNVDFSIQEPFYMDFFIGAQKLEIYLAPGYHLMIDQTGDRFAFKGRGAESNQYLLAYHQFSIDNLPFLQALDTLNEFDYTSAVHRIRVKSEAFLKNYLANQINLDPKFIERERARIRYDWANALTDYALTQEHDALSPTYFSYRRQVNLNEGHLIGLRAYQTYVCQTLINAATELAKETGEQRTPFAIAFDLIEDRISNDQVQAYSYYGIMSAALQTTPQDWTAPLFQVFKERCKAPRLVKEMQILYDQL